MKKVLSLILIVAMVMCFAVSCGDNGGEQGEQQTYRVTIGTGNSGAVFYVLGAGIADMINQKSEILDVTAQATTATSENVAGVQAGDFDFGFAVYDVADCAWKGIREYADQGKFENLRIACVGHTGEFVPFVYDDSPIKTIADLASDKYTVAVSSGFTGYWLAKVALESYGVDIDKLSNVPVMSHTEQSTGMKDGTVNVQCFTGPSPASAMLDTASFKPIRVLEQTDETLAGLLQKYPYYIKSEVPAGIYDGIDEPAQVFGVVYCIMCNVNTPDEVVTEFLTQVFDNDLTVYHNAGSFYTTDNPYYQSLYIDNAQEMLPFHPAAKAFLQSRGLALK